MYKRPDERTLFLLAGFWDCVLKGENLDVTVDQLKATGRMPARTTGTSSAPNRMQKSRPNVTLRYYKADGLPIDAIPREEVTRCGKPALMTIDFQLVGKHFFSRKYTYVI